MACCLSTPSYSRGKGRQCGMYCVVPTHDFPGARYSHYTRVPISIRVPIFGVGIQTNTPAPQSSSPPQLRTVSTVRCRVEIRILDKLFERHTPYPFRGWVHWVHTPKILQLVMKKIVSFLKNIFSKGLCWRGLRRVVHSASIDLPL